MPTGRISLARSISRPLRTQYSHCTFIRTRWPAARGGFIARSRPPGITTDTEASTSTSRTVR